MAFMMDEDMINELSKTGPPSGDHSMHGHGGHGGPNMSGDMHAGHSMSGHGGTMDHGAMGHMMSMAFHFGYDETILFSFWTINTLGGLIGSMIGIFLASMLYEGLKVFREYLLQRTLVHERTEAAGRHSAINGLRVPLATENGESPDGSVMVNAGKTTFMRPHPFTPSHMFQAFLHMFQVFVSYLLMLIFMTYNVWLALAVVLGAGAGYFLFGWRKKTIVDINEHCH